MYFKSIQEAIYKQIDDEHESVRFVQMTWMRKIAQRELSRQNDTSRRTESTNYEFRVEYKGASFSCRWLRIKFVKRGQKVLRLVDSITIPKDDRYKREQFKYAEEWELEIIEQMEEALWQHRRVVKNLMKSHRHLLEASKYGNEKLTTIPLKSRVGEYTESIKKFKEKLK
ncbi:hypothetical protein QUN99_003321 [Vibrio parahaemolyticus]|nr:hypothetical protein [Vibrio parahaemolyticus]